MTERDLYPGDIRISGGPHAQNIKVEVWNGLSWTKLRWVSKIAWSCNGAAPVVELQVQAAFVDVMTAQDKAALKLVGLEAP